MYFIKHCKGFIRASFVVLAFAATNTLLGQSYIATDLGTLGGFGSYASSINNAGQVAGFSYTAPGVRHAFLYSGGTMTDLGTLGGTNSFAFGINDSGQVTGYSDLAGNGIHHAFIYQNGAMADLVPFSTVSSEAMAINQAGQVGGTVYQIPGYNDDFREAFLYSGGVLTGLGGLGGRNSAGQTISDTGQVGGISDNATRTESKAVLSLNGGLVDTGVIGAFLGVNSLGQFVGNGLGGAMLYDNGVASSLGSGAANSINVTGMIVGISTITYIGQDSLEGPHSIINNPLNYAWIYSNGTRTDLNSLVNLNGVKLVTANDINDLGQIVAVGSNGRSYLLTPTATGTGTVPDAGSSSVMMFLALSGLAAVRRWMPGSRRQYPA